MEVNAPIVLPGPNGIPNSTEGDVCNGDAGQGATVWLGGSEVLINSTIDLSGGNGVLWSFSGEQVAGDGGFGGSLVIVAPISVELSEQAVIDFSGGDASAPGAGEEGVSGYAGAFYVESPLLEDHTEDPWNSVFWMQPTLTIDTTLHSTVGNAVGGVWGGTSSPEDFSEDVYAVYASDTDGDGEVSCAVIVALTTMTPNVNIDIIVANGITGYVVDASLSAGGDEIIEVVLEEWGPYVILVNRVPDSSGVVRAEYELTIDVPDPAAP